MDVNSGDDPLSAPPKDENGELRDCVVSSWLEQDALLRTFWHEGKTPEEIAGSLGRSVAAVMTRAARLGLPRRLAPGRKRGYKKTPLSRPIKTVTNVRVRSSRADVQEDKEIVASPSEAGPRVCLMCLKKFQSQGRHNRICPTCKGSADYVTGSATPDFVFQGGK